MDDFQALAAASWSDLTEAQPDDTKTLLERTRPERIRNEMANSKQLERWLTEGVMEVDFSYDEKFMYLIDQYAEARSKLPHDRRQASNFYNGWNFPTSYLVCPQMMALGLSHQICDTLRTLLSDSPLLHLALTGWVSTTRNWHQDSYLNPPYVWSHYIAAWIAIDDIDDNAGPFEYVPGSHRWEVLRQEKLFAHIPEHVRFNHNWPSMTEDALAKICEKKIADENAEVVRYTPKRGSVLFWHSNLMHRGTVPKDDTLLRKALIMHYSSVSKRTDMNPKHKYGHGFYFEGPTNGSTRMMQK